MVNEDRDYRRRDWRAANRGRKYLRKKKSSGTYSLPPCPFQPLSSTMAPNVILPSLPSGWSADKDFKAVGTLSAATQRNVEAVGPHFLAHARRVCDYPAAPLSTKRPPSNINSNNFYRSATTVPSLRMSVSRLSRTLRRLRMRRMTISPRMRTP